MPLLDKEAVIELHVASKGFVFSSRKLPVIVLKMGSSEVFCFSLSILGAPNHYGLIFSTRCQVFSIWTDVQIHNATTMTLGHNWEDDLGLCLHLQWGDEPGMLERVLLFGFLLWLLFGFGGRGSRCRCRVVFRHYFMICHLDDLLLYLGQADNNVCCWRPIWLA